MASEVQICNEALAFLGVPVILSLTDDSKAARHCNLIYDSKRDELLRSFEWKFATKRANLSPTTNTPAFKWTYEFKKPTDCLRLLFVGDADENKLPYVLESNNILSNYNLLYIKYTYRVEDPMEMDVLFRHALSAYMSQFLANVLGMKAEYNKTVEEYETAVAEARFQGSIETAQEEMEAEDWLQSRI